MPVLNGQMPELAELAGAMGEAPAGAAIGGGGCLMAYPVTLALEGGAGHANAPSVELVLGQTPPGQHLPLGQPAALTVDGSSTPQLTLSNNAVVASAEQTLVGFRCDVIKHRPAGM